ncbi:hypothetical protein [Streptomyces sp. NBC_01190]|uniref:hypothetical protein n=1 Tax=Streptomyces sp. NBC_01190 TaxID=2903767 RepID=UPI00386AB7A2|nr:hypothetical protein OG519_27435 [Streptomyces sp. NBC_01190]
MQPSPSTTRPHPRFGPRTRPSRGPVRALGILGALALAAALPLGCAGDSAASDTGSAGTPYLRYLPAPIGPADRAAFALDGSVSPPVTEVAQEENGEFSLMVVNTGSTTAQDVRALLDTGQRGNGIGSADGRCLSRQDARSPADLWCELGDVAPGQGVAVTVHAYMSRCVWLDPATSAPRLHAAAFHWRLGWRTDGAGLAINGATPRWSCRNRG